jgi:hypothetical protein
MEKHELEHFAKEHGLDMEKLLKAVSLLENRETKRAERKAKKEAELASLTPEQLAEKKKERRAAAKARRQLKNEILSRITTLAEDAGMEVLEYLEELEESADKQEATPETAE